MFQNEMFFVINVTFKIHFFFNFSHLIQRKITKNCKYIFNFKNKAKRFSRLIFLLFFTISTFRLFAPSLASAFVVVARFAAFDEEK